MPADSDVTLGELDRRLTDLKSDMRDGFTEVHRSIDALTFVSRDTYEARHKAVTDRLDVLEERDRWRGRTIIVSLCLPVLVAIILYVALQP